MKKYSVKPRALTLKENFWIAAGMLALIGVGILFAGALVKLG